MDHETVALSQRAIRARPEVLDAARLIREHYGQPWRLEQLAARFSVDPTHFARTFKPTFGVPPMSYLARVRAETAAALLLRSDRSITDIGAAVGWPDSNYFARPFVRTSSCLHGVPRHGRLLGADPDQASGVST